jgi:hypothetical protein
LEQKAKCDDKSAVVDSNILFSRLLVLVERSSNIEEHFSYELTSMPMSLFKDSCLRKAAKSMLAKELTKDVDTSGEHASVMNYVIDGGCLLHRVKWELSGTYMHTGAAVLTVCP